jgi:hypothetical protein
MDDLANQRRSESQTRRTLNRHPSIAVAACIVWGTLFFVSTDRGTVGLSESRPDVVRAMLVFVGLDQAHRGSNGWAYVGLGLTLMFFAVVGWGVFIGLRNYVRRSTT